MQPPEILLHHGCMSLLLNSGVIIIIMTTLLSLKKKKMSVSTNYSLLVSEVREVMDDWYEFIILIHLGAVNLV